MAKSGTVTWTATTASYRRIALVPGYWYTITLSAAGASVPIRLSGVRFQAPVQALANIEESGQTTLPMSFTTYTVGGAAVDYAVEVSTNSTDAWADIGSHLATSYIYVGYIQRFSELEITMLGTYVNAAASTLTAQYWNGSEWTALTIIDGTLTSTACFAKSGSITWSAPTAWAETRPPYAYYLNGYWIRLIVSGTLTATTKIQEVRLSVVPEPLPKFKLATLYDSNRLMLANAPESHDSVLISRPFEEYGFTGKSSYSLRVGNLGRITSIGADDTDVYFAKLNEWFHLNAQTLQTGVCDRLEFGNQVPINQRVLVRAPAAQKKDSGTIDAYRNCFYFINKTGAWCLDKNKMECLSLRLNWWDTSNALYPFLDMTTLYLSSGAYWPYKKWIVWAVPMNLPASYTAAWVTSTAYKVGAFVVTSATYYICLVAHTSGTFATDLSSNYWAVTATPGTPQAFCNRLIVFDLVSSTWLPPFTISASSLATVCMFANEELTGMGQDNIYAGDNYGRIRRLFTTTQDAGSDIACWFETGWISLDAPEQQKLLRGAMLFGEASASSVGLTVYKDGLYSTTDPNTITVRNINVSSERLFEAIFKQPNLVGRFYKIRVDFTGVARIYGLQLTINDERTLPTS